MLISVHLVPFIFPSSYIILSIASHTQRGYRRKVRLLYYILLGPHRHRQGSFSRMPTLMLGKCPDHRLTLRAHALPGNFLCLSHNLGSIDPLGTLYIILTFLSQTNGLFYYLGSVSAELLF